MPNEFWYVAGIIVLFVGTWCLRQLRLYIGVRKEQRREPPV